MRRLDHIAPTLAAVVGMALTACSDSKGVGPSDAGTPALSSPTAELLFTPLAVGSSSPASVATVANSGSGKSGALTVTLSGAGRSSFRIDSSASSCLGAPLAAGAECSIAVRFAPDSAGAHAATMSIANATGQRVGIALGGTGTASVEITKAGAGVGMVRSTPAGLQCGDTCAATFATSPVTLVAEPAEGSQFAGWSGACAGAGECVLSLSAAAAVTATFTEIPRAALAGPASAADFGVVRLGTSSAPSSITITNTGNAPTEPVATSISGAQSAAFAMDAPTSTCVDARLAAGESCVVAVRFSPSAVGPAAATLDVRAGDQAVTVGLSGTGGATVSVQRAGSGSGTVTSSPAGIDCGATCSEVFTTGSLTLAASPAAGSYFAGWSGGCSGSGSCALTLTGNATVTAAFARYPNTTLTTTPLPATNQTRATFEFTGDPGVTFECSTGGAFVPCTSPHTVALAMDASNRFAVRAKDAAGQVDPTPAETDVLATSLPLLRYGFDGSAANSGALAGYGGTASSVTYPAGKFGGAIKFDGSTATGAMLTGTKQLLERGHEWTISLWFREDTLRTQAHLLDFRTSYGTSNRGWEGYRGVYATADINTCSALGCADVPTPIGVWHNLIYRYDGASASVGGPIEIYVDGTRLEVLPNDSGIPITAPELASIRLGNSHTGLRPSVFYVDELKVFDTVFTEAEQCTRVIGGVWSASTSTCTLP